MKKILGWIVSVLAAVGAVLAFFFRRPSISAVERELEEVQEAVEDIEDRQKDRARRKDELDERFKRHFPFLLVILLAFAIPAQAADLSYDELLSNYKEVVQIAAEYKALYEEAESDLNVMVEQTKRLQQLVSEQQDIIKDLLSRKVSVSAGVTYNSDSGVGVAALATYHF